VSRIPQNCDTCHPVQPGAGPDNSATLAETYGFGNGSITVQDGDGVVHDLTGFLDPSGNLLSDFPHPDTGPVERSTSGERRAQRVADSVGSKPGQLATGKRG
jgi:hypothetical protein